MATDLFENETKPGELQIYLAAQHQFDAADVASILSAMSSDYRALNPTRRLAVSNVRSGSLLLQVVDYVKEAAPYIKDAAALAKDGKAIFEFGKMLRDELGRKKKQSVPLALPPSALLPAKTIENIVRVASKGNSDLYLGQQAPDGSKLEIHLTRPEVKHAHRLASEEKRLRKSTKSMAALPGPAHFQTLIEGIASVNASDAATIIKVAALAMDPRQRREFLQILAENLQRLDRRDLANLVIDELKRTGRN